MARWVESLTGLSGLVADLDDVHAEYQRTHGSSAAHAWYARQLVRGGWSLFGERSRSSFGPHSSLGGLVRTLGVEMLWSVRRLRHRVWTLSLPFAVLVGLGVAASVFMVQTRESMQHPDLGFSTRIDRVFWRSEDGSRLGRLPTGTDLSGVVALGGAEGRDGRDGRDEPYDFDALLPVASRSMLLRAPTRWLSAGVQLLPPRALTTLGVRPIVGRDLEAAGDVVLSYDFWRTHWTDEGGLGDELFVSPRGVRFHVVGVAPPSFDGPVCCVRPAAWMVDGETSVATVATSLYVVGLKHEAGAKVALESWLGSVLPDAAAGPLVVEFLDGRDQTGALGDTLEILLGLAWLAFAGTLLNGINLLGSDMAALRREFGLRRALGASPLRVMCRVWCETLWLSLAAALVGAIGAALLMRTAPLWIPMLNTPGSVVNVTLGWPAVIATALAAGAVAVLTGVPVLVAAGRLNRGLLDRTAGATTGRSRVPTFLLAGQIALAVVLAAASLLHQRAIADLDQDFVGFRESRTGVFFASGVTGVAPGDSTSFLRQLSETPGIEAAALSRSLPVYGAPQLAVTLANQELSLTVEQATLAYFETLGLHLVVGELPRSEAEGVLSEDAARRFGLMPTVAIGSSIRVGESTVRVVGIAEAASWGTGDDRPSLYRGWAPADVPASAVLLVRPSPGAPVPSIQRVADVAQSAGLALSAFGTLDSLLVRSRVMAEFLASSAGVFSLFCFIVALGGLATHFFRWVRFRRRDFGIRMCLGASGGRTRLEVYRAALMPLGLGLIAGTVLAGVGAGAMVALMPELPSGRLTSIALADLLVLGFAAATLVLPAALAGRTNPLEVLRRD